MFALSRGMKRFVVLAAAALCGAAMYATVTVAADFVQPAHDAEFIKAARRQDQELLKFYGNQVPAGTEFCHLGSFRASVHRNGLEKSLTLVPPRALRYETAEDLRKDARANDVVIGAIKLTYGSVDPEIVPGTILLIYDGLRVHLHDTHSMNLAQYPVTLTEAPLDAKADPAMGELLKTDHSVANVLPDGTLQIYMQLANAKGEAIMDGGVYRKQLLEFRIDGIVTDDNSAPIQLATPKADEKGSKPAGKSKSDDDNEGSPPAGSGHHH